MFTFIGSSIVFGIIYAFVLVFYLVVSKIILQSIFSTTTLAGALRVDLLSIVIGLSFMLLTLHLLKLYQQRKMRMRSLKQKGIL